MLGRAMAIAQSRVDGMRSGFQGRAVAAARPALAVVGLTIATYLALGYRYGVWPQPPMLEYALRYSGELTNDWYLGFGAPHWAFSHFLALPPIAWLENVVAVVWVAQLFVLWGAIVSICRTLGLSWTGTVGTGLIVLSTALGGVGGSAPILDSLYPTSVSFAFAVAGFAAILRSRLILAGVFLGLAALAHPGLGVLAIVVIAPAVFVVGRPTIRSLLRFGVPMVALAFPSILRAVLDQAAGSSLTATRRFELVAIVRSPHHMLYGEFPTIEYVRTALWVLALAVGLLVVRRFATRAFRAIALSTACILALCAAGAAASANGGPLLLVQIQTARITPFLILFGIATGAAALSRFQPRFAPLILIAIPLLVPRTLFHAGTVRPALVSDSSIEALALLAALTAALVLDRLRLASGESMVFRRVASIAVVLALGATATSLLRQGHHGLTPEDLAWQAVADETRAATGPGEIILTPPDQGGFRLYSHRAIVIDFGDYQFGPGEAQWAQRIIDVTGNRRVLDPSLGRRADLRGAMIGDGYEAVIASSRAPICRYRIRFVVTRLSTNKPAWLDAIYRNDFFALYRVAPDTCSASA